MATIKDIAKKAGVSQGTVSNVLNGKEFVRSEKILRVLEAAHELGYSVNKRARWLRAGKSNLVAVILPTLHAYGFADFYQSLEKACAQDGFAARLYISDGNVQKERAILESLKGELVHAVVTCSVLPDGQADYAVFGNVLYVGNKPSYPCTFLGFDIGKAVKEIQERIKELGVSQVVCFVSASMGRKNDELFHLFQTSMDPTVKFRMIPTSEPLRYRNSMSLFEEPMEKTCVVTDSLELADTVRNIRAELYPSYPLFIISLSSFKLFGQDGITTYEFDYRLLGNRIARMAIGKETPRSLTLDAWGFQSVGHTPAKHGVTLRIATLDSPTVRAMDCLKHMYKQATGVDVVLQTYTYEELYGLLQKSDSKLDADIIRMDSTLLSWFAMKVFTPLEQINPHIQEKLTGYLDCLDRYAMVEGHVYSLPGTPSAKMLFYRKDIFSDLEVRCCYKETYKKELEPPVSFAEYNQIAHFLTRAENPSSPTLYGSTLTAQTSDVAGVEFLIRYFSHAANLFGDDGSIFPDKAVALQSFRELLDVQTCAQKEQRAWWTDSVDDFIKGQTAMTIQYPNHVAAFLNPESSIIDRVGWAPVPGGRPLQGGSAMGVYRYSLHKQEALDYMLWVNQDRVATACTLLGGLSPKIATYQNQEVLETYPWLTIARKTLASAVSTIKPPHVNVFNEQATINTLGNAVIGVLSHRLTINQAIDYVVYAHRLGQGGAS